jgi:hypothetical protein
MNKCIQWSGTLALVIFEKRQCSHKIGQKKVIPFKTAKRYERRGTVTILKIIENL